MKIVSWDVGIKNLAYCILEESNDNEKPFNIYDWNIINLTEKDEKCHGFIDNESSECCKKITSKLNILNDTYYFCDIHKFQVDKLKNKYLNDFKECKINKCEIIIKSKGLPCNKESCFNFKNKYYCQHHYNQLKKNLEKCKIEKFKFNANKIPIEEIKLNMINKLDKISDLLNVDYCVIENQPAMKNPKMKAISDTLYTWFLIRGCVDKVNNSKLKKVVFCSPSNKLKIDNDNTIKLLNNTKNDTEKYKLTKELGILYCSQLIKNDEKYLTFFNSWKKKDDLADAFLQGIYYIKIVSKL